MLVLELDVALASVGDNGDDSNDVPSVSLDVPVSASAVVFVFAVASVPSRTISKGREGEKEGKGGGVCQLYVY